MNLNRLFDVVDYGLCRLGVLRFARWEKAMARRPVRLYAGKLRRGLPQWSTHWGITPFYASTRNIWFDATAPYPIPDGSVDIYQSEDVFEHIEKDRIVGIFDEVHRILRPGGVFRLSLPDYNFDGYRDRTERGPDGAPQFDPGGGGRFADGAVVEGGHLWFPTIDQVRELFEASRFGKAGDIRYLQFAQADGQSVLGEVDYSIGHIQRTPDHDPRVADRPRAISIVVDAIKLAE